MDTSQASDPWWERLPPVTEPSRTDACAKCGHTRALHEGRLNKGFCNAPDCPCIGATDWRISLFIGKPDQVSVDGIEMDCFLAPPWKSP